MSILDILDRPIAYHRVFVTLTGSVKGAVLLSQAVYWQKRAKQADGWWYKTAEEWQEETGLTRHEQDKARKDCEKYLKSDLRGVPATNYWKVDEDALSADLLAGKQQASLPENGKQDFRFSENIKRNTETTTETTQKKKTFDMLTLTRKILEGSMTIENAIAVGVTVTEDMRKAAEARDQAPKSFEAALGFSKPLPWWSSKEWTTFSVWVVEQYIADQRIFEKFEAWRNTPFVKGSISNQRIRGFVTEFYDAFDMFLKTIKKDEPEYVPPVVDSPYAQTADKVFAPMSPELKARHEAVRAKLNANVAKEKRPA